jgi:hypothetical protein
MPSTTYVLFREAILHENQVTCVYSDHYRELCPVVMGHDRDKDGKTVEKVLAYQFAGETSSHLPPGGEWRCLILSKVRDARLRDGPWYEGSRHETVQTCVEDVDLDVNIHVRRRR